MYSITAACIPKQIPRNGTKFSRAYLIAETLPSIPLTPNPPNCLFYVVIYKIMIFIMFCSVLYCRFYDVLYSVVLYWIVTDNQNS